MWGLADDVFTGEWGRRWHERIPHATWDAFDDAGHFLQDTHGDLVARAVLDRIGGSNGARGGGSSERPE